MLDFVDDRKSLKIAVRPSADEAVGKFADEYGMTKFVVASKLFEWFADQDDLFKRSVMGMLHGLEVDAAREFMKRVAGPSRSAEEIARDFEKKIEDRRKKRNAKPKEH